MFISNKSYNIYDLSYLYGNDVMKTTDIVYGNPYERLTNTIMLVLNVSIQSSYNKPFVISI